MVEGKRVGPPVEETEHYIKCSECGSWIDMRDLSQVLAHEEPGHKPEGVQ
jgi:hypothetical protein